MLGWVIGAQEIPVLIGCSFLSGLVLWTIGAATGKRWLRDIGFFILLLLPIAMLLGGLAFAISTLPPD